MAKPTKTKVVTFLQPRERKQIAEAADREGLSVSAAVRRAVIRDLRKVEPKDSK